MCYYALTIALVLMQVNTFNNVSVCRVELRSVPMGLALPLCYEQKQMVPQEGFEPSTAGVEIQYSIQLSY